MLSTTRCFAAFYVSLILSLLSTLPCASAADAKVANRTIDRTVQLRTHSIHPPYIDEDLQNRWWDFGADAYIVRSPHVWPNPRLTSGNQNTNKHIRLTRAVPSQMGWLWSRLPLSTTNFVVEIEFKISGQSGHLYGDGMAIWLTTERTQPGPVFGNQDKFDGLGIFIDTYANSRHAFGFPRVVAMLGDGKTAYDQDNDGEANSIGACSANVRRTNVITKLRITYIKDGYLDVSRHAHSDGDDWSDCFRVDGLKLPAQPFLGVSALTGQVFDGHDIISITTSSAILSSQDAPLNKLSSGGFFGGGRRPDGSRSSWLSYFVKLVFLAAMCVGGVYGFKAYQLRSRRRHHGTAFADNGAGAFGGFGMSDRGYGSRRRF
ncbi:legume-like lectin family-domain-containing protein [Chiua virens]|nr:legume-like lectin family-domain-containing protein [Chiua virens]